MNEDDVETLLRELHDQGKQHPERSSARTSGPDTSGSDLTGSPPLSGIRLDRSFASEYLDELIIGILFRCEEANGMEIIREFTHLFGVQFSPETVYPHLHSLEEDGILARRDCVQTKEYRIADAQTAREYITSTVTQLSCLSEFLDTTPHQSDGDRR